MNLKLLRSTLCLLAVSALCTDGAIAQAGAPSSASDAKAKFAKDQNEGHFDDSASAVSLFSMLEFSDAPATSASAPKHLARTSVYSSA